MGYCILKHVLRYSCYFVLYCIVLCYAYAVLSCVTLCYVALCSVLFRAILICVMKD